MDYNLTGSIAANVNLTRPPIEYIFLILIALITASAGIAGVYVGQRSMLRSEAEMIARTEAKEQTEDKKLAYYKFIEVFTTPYLASKNDKLETFDYLRAALDLNEFGNLVAKDSLSIQYIDMNDKLNKKTIISLDDLIIFIITLRNEGLCNHQSRDHFPNLFDEVRFKASYTFIPLIKDVLVNFHLTG